MKRILALVAFSGVLRAADHYVDAAAGGTHDGSSWTNAWTSFAQISQSGLNAGDVVWVKHATYDERFAISKGGSSTSARISYVGVPDGSGNRPILRGVNGASYSYIAIINFEFTHTGSGNNYNVIQLTSGGGWLIQDCYIHDTYEDGIRSAYGSTSSNNIVRHCTFNNIQILSLGAQFEGRMVSFEGNHNLVEYCTFGYGLDRVKVYKTGNIVRNNYDQGTGTAADDYTGASPYPFHIDFVQIDNENNDNSTQVLVSNNFVRDNYSTTGDAHFVIYQDSVGTGFDWFVTRFNVAARIGEAFSINQRVDDSYFYNNTVPGTYNLHYANQPPVTWNSGTLGNVCDFRNNSFCYSSATMGSTPLIIPTENRPTNFTADRNHRYQIGAANSLPTPATSNIGAGASTDPLFADGTGVYPHDDYSPTSGSPLKAAGAGITTAVGNGSSSTSLTVAASKPICDGWGIVDADWIKVGTSAYVQVASIDYGTNVITLASPLSWSNGDAVFIYGMEDVGALPYKSAGLTPVGTFNATAHSVTVNDETVVRAVWFYVGSQPTSIVYTTLGTKTYTDPNGTADAAVMASMWASETPVVSAPLQSAVTPAHTRRASAAACWAF